MRPTHNIAPEGLFFVDDQKRHPGVAMQLGIASHVFRNVAAVIGDLEGRAVVQG